MVEVEMLRSGGIYIGLQKGGLRVWALIHAPYCVSEM
jgi:hypothetical protein